MDLIKLLSNPVRIQIVQYLQTNGEASAKQIAGQLRDIPTPTIYRHIQSLLKEELLIVTKESKVRGSLERTLAINIAKFASYGEGNIAEVAYHFLMGLYTRFYQYGKKSDADPMRDMICLRTSVLTLTDKSFEAFLLEIGGVIAKYQEEKPDGEAKARNISFITIPADAEE